MDKHIVCGYCQDVQIQDRQGIHGIWMEIRSYVHEPLFLRLTVLEILVRTR